MVIDFANIGIVKEPPVLVLKNADGTPKQTLGYAFNLSAEIHYNEMSTVLFDLPAFVDGKKTPHYDDVIGMRIVDMRGWGQFILMNPETENDGIKAIKHCKAYSLEYELTYKQVFFPEGTYNLWNPLAPDNTVLGMILADFPSWSVGHVDESLIGKYRTFSEDGTNFYNFIKSTIQKSYGCIFDFDTYNRKINIYDAHSNVVTNSVYLSFENLAKEIRIEEDTENIVTVLDVNGAESVDIRIVNPLGTNKIYNLDYFMNTTHFSQELVDKWKNWKSSFQANQLPFYNLSVERSLKTSAILTEQVALTDLNGEMQVLENERSVYISYMARLSNGSSEYVNYQTKLLDVNERIAKKQEEISLQKAKIKALENEQNELYAELKKIQNAVAFTNPAFGFSESDLMALDRYFKEDSIEDSTFVVQTVDSYDGSDISNTVTNTPITFSGGNITKVVENGKSLYTIIGGVVSCGFTANVIRSSIEYCSNDGSFVLSSYLGSGNIGEKTFQSGCISMTGICLTPSDNLVTEVGSTNYFTGSVVSATISSAKLYFTTNATEYQKQAVSWELYDYGISCLNALAYPTYTFQVSSANFFSLNDFRAFVNQLRLGEKIYLNTGEEILEPLLIGVTLDFEDLSSLTLEFSDKYSSADKAFNLVDLLDQSISMGKTLDANKFSYSAFVSSGASSQVKDFMSAALDLAKNQILSASGLAPTMDDSGLHLRKYLDSKNPEAGYEDEEIAMINNAIVFTDDGWQNVKMAIGKIFGDGLTSYPRTKDIQFNEEKTYYYKTSEGKYEVWNGDAVAWSAESRPELYELEASAYGIAAPYIVGTILAGQNLIITTPDGAFRVDESGVHVDSMKFFITHGSAEYESLDNVLQESEDSLNRFVDNVYAPNIATIENLIDGRVNTFYQSEVPSEYETGVITDEEALTLAKSRVGDLWYDMSDTENGSVYVYTEEKTGQFGWVKREDIENELLTLIDGKATTYYQEEQPHNEYTSQENNGEYNVWVGDLWYDTKSKCSYIYTKSINSSDNTLFDYTWNTIEAVPKELYDKVDTKRQVFITTPIPPYDVGDLWVQGSTGDILRCKATKQSGDTYSENDWVKASKYTDDSALDSFKEAYLQDGYLNASKMKGVINSLITDMGDVQGNVLFDNYGFWLMNGKTKGTATKAIWMNEKGIVFGSGKAVGEEGDLTKDWTWTTAIGHDGIVADAIAGKTISGIHISGGDIDIGNGQFTVDNKGNLTANSGTFKGTLDAPTLKGNLNAAENAWLIGCGINIGSGNFYVDTSGNVTMKGSINLSNGTIKWGSSNSPVKVQYSATGSSWHSTFVSTDYYARYSYDGGSTWTSAILIQGKNGIDGKNGTDGKDGRDGSDGSDANVTFRNVNSALSTLFKTWSGGTPTSMSGAYIYAPQVKGGNFYGSNFYAGDGDGYTQMNAAGLNVFDANGNNKIGLGYYSNYYSYPYLSLGIGSGVAKDDAGLVMKFGSGIWLGTSDVVNSGGSRPPTGHSTTTGIFVDFSADKIYQYIQGTKSELGSGSSGSGTTATAVFG